MNRKERRILATVENRNGPVPAFVIDMAATRRPVTSQVQRLRETSRYAQPLVTKGWLAWTKIGFYYTLTKEGREALAEVRAAKKERETTQ